jgi:formate hydrogenlyase transcriptional activator
MLGLSNTSAYGDQLGLDCAPTTENLPPNDRGGGAVERYRALLEINNTIITKLAQDELLHAFCEGLKRVVRFDLVGLVLYEPENDVLRVAALEGLHQTSHFGVGREVSKESPARWVFDHQRPILRQDLETERQYPAEHLAFAEGLRSLCALPLVVRGESIGVLFVTSLTTNQYSEEDVSFLHKVANQIALAIKNMQSYEKIAALNAQVARSEGRWRTVFENSAIGVALTDLDGRFLAANRAYQKMVGYSEQELRNLSFLEVTHEDYRESNLTLRAELLEGIREQFQVEKQYRRKDGSLIWVHNDVSLVTGAESPSRFFITLCEDIGERKHAQEALRKSEERWRSVFENSAIGVALTDLDGRFLTVNRAYEEMLGYTEEALRRLSFLDVTHEESRESNRALVAELLEGKREQFQVEKQYRRKDGSLIWVSDNVALVPSTESMPRFLMALSEDITERKQAEEALSSSEERVRLIIDSVAEAIFGCDPEGTCLFCNQAALRLLGYDDRAELLGKNMHALEHHTRPDGTPYPRAECPIYVGFQKGEGVHREDEVFWRKDGTSFPVEYWSHPMFRNGSTVGAVITFIDITERKRAEEALRKSERRKRTLLEINNAIITNLTQQALFESVSAALVRVIPFDRAAFLLHDPETGACSILAIGRESPKDCYRARLQFARKETIGGWVVEHQRAAVRRDLEREQQFPSDRHFLAEGVKSDCVVPLIVRGKSIGALHLVSETKNQYSDEDAEFVQEVANQVALAVGNMKAYEQIRSLKARLEAENVYLQEELLKEHNFDEIVGNSPALLEVLRQVEMAAPTDASVLLYGETGSGKELIARAIHSRSVRKDRAMVTVNCGAIPAGLVESELFGHVKGAFTGALHNAVGRFELADGSTLFLDEVGELPLETQIKLLRVLQEHEFQTVGSSKTTHVNVRVIAATNRNLEEDVRTGRFRSDLFYRLNVLPLRVPPLRERQSDIPQLVLFFLERSCQKFGKKIEAVSQETVDQLMTYEWPGNIRELQNIIERGVVLSHSPILSLDRDLLPRSQHPTSSSAKPIAETAERLRQPEELAKSSAKEAPPRPLEDVERAHILLVLEHTQGRIDGPKGAAQILELHPSTLRARMKKLGIERPRH